MFVRFDDMYQLILEYRDGKTGLVREDSFNRSVAEFFDENGVLCFDLLEDAVLRLHSNIAANPTPNKKNS